MLPEIQEECLFEGEARLSLIFWYTLGTFILYAGSPFGEDEKSICF
jgi:hypothetical protein